MISPEPIPRSGDLCRIGSTRSLKRGVMVLVVAVSTMIGTASSPHDYVCADFEAYA